MSRDLLLVGVSLFTWGMGEGMFLIFQPLYLQQMGASPVEIGAILGVVGIFMSFVQAPAGYLTDRIGPRSIMISSWFLGLLSAATMAWAPSLPVFVVGMVMYGMTSFVVAPMNAYVTRARGRLSLERALTINSSMYSFGAIIGPALGGALGALFGLQSVYRFSTAVFLISTIIIFMIGRYPAEHHAAAATGGGGLLSKRYLAFLGLSFLVFFSSYLSQPLTPNYLHELHNISLESIGTLGSIGSLSNALITLVLGSLNARWGVLVGQLLLSLFVVFLWKGTGMVWYILAYSFLGGYRLVRLLALAFARPLVHAARTGLAYGLIETVNAVAIVLAPIAAGFLYSRNPGSMYSVSLVLMGASFAACFFLMPVIARQERPLEDLLDLESKAEVSEP